MKAIVTDNTKVESCSRRFRHERLNTNGLLSLEDVKAKIEAWREYDDRRKSLWDNEAGLHSALKWAPPSEFAHQARERPNRAYLRSRKFIL